MTPNAKDLNVLMLGSDMSILKPGSDAYRRMKEYGSLVNRLDIAIYNGHLRGGNEDNVYQIAPNVFAHPRSFLGLLGLFRVSSRKLSFVLNHRVDLITSQDPFILGLIGEKLAKWLNTGFQAQIHTDLMSPYFRRESLYNRLKVMIAKSILKRATGVRVVSQKIKDSIRKIRTKAEPVVLPIWTDIEAMKKSPVRINLKEKYPQFKKIFLMASRLTVEKNIFLAVDAMKNILKERHDVGLVIVGEGPYRKLIEGLARGEGLQKNIIFEDWSEDLPSYYKTCDVFLNTSNYEGYGRTIIEALSAGTPVVTTDVGIAKEFVRGGENGFVVPVGSKKELEKVLKKIVGEDDVLADLKAGTKKTELPLGTKEEYLEAYVKGWVEATSSR
ncbi:MAG TPA: glycosyltransferase [Candidatus Paceibacterota bacterium]|nr:glycosyltransferase [Candidatus Paceibacterota bacterium]